jgi:hypothetical protein
MVLFFVTFVCFNSTIADGGFFPTEVEQIGNSAQSPNQRAIIIHDGQKETMIVQVKYSGNIQDFAWVVPLATLPDDNSIQVESDSIFTLLHDLTQPKVYRIDMSKVGRGGGGGGYDNNMEEVEDLNSAQVQVWQSLAIGPYEVNIISGASTQALRDWLNNNGYEYSPTADAILDFYIQKNWYFMATKVNVESQQVSDNSIFQAGLPALKVSFPVDKPVFPLRISEISSAQENEIEIYVVSDHRMISDSYNTYAMVRDEVENLIKEQLQDPESDNNTGIACACQKVFDPIGENSPKYDYESIFRNKLSSLNSRTFIIENVSNYWTSHDYTQYAESGVLNGFFNSYFPEGSNFWITRLRTILKPEDMINDVTFIPDPVGDDQLFLSIFIEEYNPWNVSAFGIPLLFLFPLVFSKKIRKRYWEHNLLIVIALYLMIV